eukprot:6172443-Pleurochrysis_carterae.AAC.1
MHSGGDGGGKEDDVREYGHVGPNSCVSGAAVGVPVKIGDAGWAFRRLCGHGLRRLRVWRVRPRSHLQVAARAGGLLFIRVRKARLWERDVCMAFTAGLKLQSLTRSRHPTIALLCGGGGIIVRHASVLRLHRVFVVTIHLPASRRIDVAHDASGLAVGRMRFARVIATVRVSFSEIAGCVPVRH